MLSWSGRQNPTKTRFFSTFQIFPYNLYFFFKRKFCFGVLLPSTSVEQYSFTDIKCYEIFLMAIFSLVFWRQKVQQIESQPSWDNYSCGPTQYKITLATMRNAFLLTQATCSMYCGLYILKNHSLASSWPWPIKILFIYTFFKISPKTLIDCRGFW